MQTKLLYAALAALPLLFTPALFFMLAEGWLDLGGGDKDIVMTLPYFIWALIFFIAALVLIIKKWSLKRWLARATLISIAAMLILFAITYATNWLGVA